MKRISLIIFLFIGFIFSCLAQPEHRITASVGFYNHTYILDEYKSTDHYYNEQELYDYHNYNDTIICTGNRTELKSKPINLNIHYECMLGKRAGIGVCVGYNNLKIKQYTETDTTFSSSVNTTIHYWGDLHKHLFIIMPEAIINYFKRTHLAMYGKLGFGLSLCLEKNIIYADSKSDSKKMFRSGPSLQYTLLGIEIGGMPWRGFAEFGYGYQGVAQVGVKYTFKKKEDRVGE